MLSRIKDTLILVGNEKSSRGEMRDIFKVTYNLLEAESVSQAMMLMEQNRNCVAMTIMDISPAESYMLPLFMEISKTGTDIEIPVVVVIDAAEGEQREERAFVLGAADVILKPYSVVSVQKRIKVLIDLYMHKWDLERILEKQSKTIRDANQTMLDTLSAIIEYRSAESGNHILRIRRFTKILLEEVEKSCPEYELAPNTIDVIASASALHDIGKISIPDAILNKPGKLTDDEYEVIKQHTTVGARLVESLNGMGDEQHLRYAYNISLYHHERWDGNGYPFGLKGDDIPICAQVVGIADAFDALITERVYKPAYPYSKAFNMILNGECGMFSPKLLECFKHVKEKMMALAREYAVGYSPKNDNIMIPLPGPVWKNKKFDTLHMLQSKYQTLLHFINYTVLEVDLDSDIYHVVYNPNVELDSILSRASFRDIITFMRNNVVHPDDRDILDEIKNFIEYRFFSFDLKRHSFFLRIFNPVTENYQGYEIVFIKIDTGDRTRKATTVIWRKKDNEIVRIHEKGSLHSLPALYGLVSSAIRCIPNDTLTIDAGHSDLLNLSGYKKEDILDVFGNSFISLVHEEDRDILYDAVQKTMKDAMKIEIEFRMKNRDMGHIWVLAKARMHVEEDGREYIYFAIRDNSISVAKNEQLAYDIERNQILIDQTGSIVFEWDIKSDSMYCSPKWAEHFGYIPISENYGSQMGIATHFHPDDLAIVRKTIDNVKNGLDKAVMDVRIANAEGKYLWMRITSKAIRDKKGELIKIIGILQDIDELKRATIIMEERAHKDSLTKLNNKMSVQELIEQYLKDREKESMAGLIVLDLDNFKTINDTYGHMYGDVVLTCVADTLKKVFRSYDIVGRVGGDEFIVFLKDIPGRELLKSKCEMLLDSLRTVLNKLVSGLKVSCSVGVAVLPEHGLTYNDLFLKADEALYNAKKMGKDRYIMYAPKAKYSAVMADETHTRIDSDDPMMVTSESFERFVFDLLYKSKDVCSTIEDLLAFVGTSFNLSRVYIFENNEDNTACSNTFEWCNEDIEPEKDNLQNVSYITDIPGWPDVYDERGVLYCTDITSLAPQFRAVLEPQNIKSMLQCVIADRGVFRGYIGFDECRYNRLWTQEQLKRLEFMASALAVFLIRERNHAKLKDQGQ